MHIYRFPRVDGAKYFADISEKSYFPSESEILFTLGSIFRIINVLQDIGKIHIIQMKLYSYNDNSTRPELYTSELGPL
jgi:hypothetical protein